MSYLLIASLWGFSFFGFHNNFGPTAIPATDSTYYLLLESGDNLLIENGDALEIEH